MRPNPLNGFSVTPQDVAFIGEGLQRPESIVACADGTLFCSDGRGGVMRIGADGRQTLIRQTPSHHGSEPNGLALGPDGTFLIANFGLRRLERMDHAGRTEILLDQVDGRSLGKVNFVMRDRKGRIWITVSTDLPHQSHALKPDVADGYVLVLDQRGARIVADGFAFTNECRFDAREEWLYVAETAGRRVTRLRISETAEVLEREVFGPSNTGGFVDGIAFDSYGNLWGTHIMSDRIFALTPQGDMRIILDDAPQPQSDDLYAAFEGGTLSQSVIHACGGRVAPFTASITFGGPDLKTVYLGSIKGTALATFRSPVAGLPLTHWEEPGR